MKQLTDREQQVLVLLCSGMRNLDIARELSVGSETVKSHLKSIFIKMDVTSRHAAVAVAHRAGMVPADWFLVPRH